VPRLLPVLDGLPLLLLLAAAFVLRGRVADWVLMWMLSLSLFAGCKWLTYRKALSTGTKLGPTRSIGYLLAWVGMEPEPFASRDRPPLPGRKEWLLGLGRIVAGLVLLWGAARCMPSSAPLLAGWTGMLGIILLLHFGFFQILALAWQRAGVPVKPLMRAPLGATSLGDLWGARWNTGFHALAHRFLFRPLQRHFGRIAATLAVFLASGLVHELVITVPARGGYGLPTAYFLLQGAGLLLERSTWGRRLGLGTGIPGRAFTLIFAALPAIGLFPPVFVRHVILPMLHAIGTT
jgi:alginate O-acetyltransferase complex protein AlgI